ncbi:O-methyltransferase [Dietzia psychralcaliphila]|uniref:Methyltransferase n=1 Tax=Dietzia psychralcaliphila TaxID=139021 RepID=A0AAD0JT72_9ACTN|nr:O-methyltransferase [Dietzia psychralcaliphila]AWH96834.1 methyltransferase [Dietzia psychralcaliphila]PTM89486.1 putative O-methyltransferase YrrM [Dietzia psychralcaliphila]
MTDHLPGRADSPDRDSRWAEVDAFFDEALGLEDEVLREVREATAAADLPGIEVSAAQARFLALLCRMVGARRVLEFGTLGGYSATSFARALGDDGEVVTFEIDPRHAEVARANLERAGVPDRVTVLMGPAAESAQGLIDSGAEPFDLVFIDADKPSNPRYVELALQLTRPGSVIVVDNVVRRGGVADSDSDDPGVLGSREVLQLLGGHPRLDATALQTVGAKGWDGFALARVR